MQVESQFHAIVPLTIINTSNETETLTNNVQHDEQSRAFIFTILITICISIIILLTILGNILVLIALCVDFALRSPTHLLMGNLACADLLLGITVLPFSGTLEVLQGRWLFGQTLCHIWLAIDVLYCTASIYGLMFISIERYVGVTRPLRYPIIVTHRRTICAILLAWIVAALVSITQFLGWQNKVKSIGNTCDVNDDLFYVLFSCSFSFYIPLVIILCVYGRIYGEAIRQYQFLTGGQKRVHLKQTVGEETVTLRVHLPKNLLSTTTLANGHSMPSTSNEHRLGTNMPPNGSNKFSKLKRERKAAKTLGIVVGMFILCWLPFFLLLPIQAFTSTDPGVVFSICFWLGYCNSCFNPFIYAFSSREFRRSFKSILNCQRIKKYRPSTNCHRISIPTSDPMRPKRSTSCDLQTSSSSAKSEATKKCRTSDDYHHNILMAKLNKTTLNPPCQTTRNECTTNRTIPKSVSTPDNTSPWHLRKSYNVR